MARAGGQRWPRHWRPEQQLSDQGQACGRYLSHHHLLHADYSQPRLGILPTPTTSRVFPTAMEGKRVYGSHSSEEEAEVQREEMTCSGHDCEPSGS